MIPDRKLKILLIEDDEVDCMIMERSLKKSGVEADVTVANDAETGVRFAANEKFDCIFLDYQLPGNDGLKGLKKLKSIGVDSPIIVTTSQGDEKIAVEMMKAGAFDYVPKKFLTAQLIPQLIRDSIRFTEIENQRRRTEEALKRSENRYKDLVENTQALICTHDEEGKILSVNSAVTELLGYEKEDIVGNNIYDFLTSKAKPAFLRYLQNLKADNIVSGILELRTRKRKVLYLSYRNFLYDGGEDTKPYVIGSALNITDRILAEHELTRAKKLAENAAIEKEMFLANMSHEIRTPMNAIIGFTDMLLETELTESQREYIEAVRSSGENLLVVINDILDFSKIHANKLELSNTAVNLSSILADTVRLFKIKTNAKNINLILEEDDRINKNVITDPVRLSQVLVNLTSNAVKFTEKGNVIIKTELLSSTDTSQKIRFIVSDNGIGIAENKLDKIFESFTQETNDTTRKYGGTGLGLSIVKKLTELMNSEIKVKSVQGAGSEFYFTLNLENAPVEQDLIEQSSTDYNGLKGTKILVAEDNEFNLVLVQKMLDEFGCITTKVKNGEDAVKEAAAGEYDIILMDIHMPVMDGFTASKKIRKEISSTIPIVAVTARAIKGEEDKCIEAGMDSYLSKPYKKAGLYNKICSVLKNRENTVNNTDKFYIPEPEIVTEKMTDMSILYEVYGDDKDGIISMLEMFLNETPADLKELQDNVAQKNFDSLHKNLHKLKSTIKLFTQGRTVELADKIELSAIYKDEQAFHFFNEFYNNCVNLMHQLKLELHRMLKQETNT